MRVLAVGAHPDDLEILCGGTLARFVAEGHSVVMCHVSDGNCGSFEIEPPQLARVRSEEAAVAAAVPPVASRSSMITTVLAMSTWA